MSAPDLDDKGVLLSSRGDDYELILGEDISKGKLARGDSGL
ncbi:hypothetical protein [Halonatronum saccharophilum]